MLLLLLSLIPLLLNCRVVDCQSCTAIFQSIRTATERNTNTAVHKGYFSSGFDCGKYCGSRADCMGFTVYSAEPGATACAFFNTIGPPSDMASNIQAEYYERIMPGNFYVNSVQFYKDTNHLILNGDTQVAVYKITAFSADTGIVASLEVSSPLETMYPGWSVPPQASLFLSGLRDKPTLLFNGRRHECYKRYTGMYFEKCREAATYTLFNDVFTSTAGKPLDAAISDISNAQIVYTISNNMVFYANDISTITDEVVFKAKSKYSLIDTDPLNPWTNIPSGYTAIAMIDASHAVIFTGLKYHLYNIDKKVVLKSGYLGDPGTCEGCPICSKPEEATRG